MIKLLINNFNNVTVKDNDIIKMIAKHEDIIQKYIAEDLNHFKSEIKGI
jgi:hypothetical protein